MKKFIAVALILCSLLILCSCQSEPREVRTARIDENGELVIYFTDGTKSTVGVVKGEKGDTGENGKDGVDGKDGENGKDGKDGEDGEEGQRGPAGLSGRSVADVSVGEGGNFIVTYSDSSTTEIALLGQLYLFGGKCGDNAYWGLYNGGILIIGGEGATDGYSESSPAPWSILIPMRWSRHRGLPYCLLYEWYNRHRRWSYRRARKQHGLPDNQERSPFPWAKR